MRQELASTYKKLLHGLQLRNIVCSKSSYARQVSCSRILNKGEKDIGIFRASFQPEYYITEDCLRIPVGYKLDIKANEEIFASFEFVYEVEFGIADMKIVESTLENQEIRSFFLGYQMEKFVWSYLRSAFSDACSRLGVHTMALPMKL